MVWLEHLSCRDRGSNGWPLPAGVEAGVNPEDVHTTSTTEHLLHDKGLRGKVNAGAGKIDCSGRPFQARYHAPSN